MGDAESVKSCRKRQLNQQNVCNRFGTCGDGKEGSGSCACIDGFSGPACKVGSCAEGHYLRAASGSPEENLFECVKCEAGKFCAKPGSDEQKDGRKDCAAGYHCAAGVTKPTACAPGSFTDDPAVECKKCPPGRFQDAEAGAKCKACAPGRFCAAGATEEARCTPGRFSPSPERPCEECAVGTFAQTAGAAKCEACGEGSFCVAGSSKEATCQLCPKGHGQRVECTSKTDRVCELCPAGKSSAVADGSPCTACAAGKVAPAGASECSACVANAEVRENGCVCMAGFFATTAVDPPTVCAKCPDGVDCAQAGKSWGGLELKVGFWQNKAWVSDVDGLLDQEVEKCKIGQWTAEEVDADPLCLGGANWTKCREGHEGVMCQVGGSQDLRRIADRARQSPCPSPPASPPSRARPLPPRCDLAASGDIIRAFFA